MAETALYSSTAVKALFDEMARTYGVVNLVTSFGFAALWRHQCIARLPLSADCRDVADLMSGMGELWRSIAGRMGAETRVVAVDLSDEMVRRGPRVPPCIVDIRIEDVLQTSAPSGAFDAVVSTFGLKTFDDDQIDRLAALVARLLRPGGTFSFVEISVPPNRVLRGLYMFYLKRVIPLLGRLLLGNPENYRMLGVYTEAFGDSRRFVAALERAGLEATFVRYFFGCASGAIGRKPATERY